MNARERRKLARSAQRMAEEIAASQPQIVKTPPPPPEPVVVVTEQRDLPIDFVVAVMKLAKKHGEGSIHVRHEGDVMTIAVGEAAERIRSGRPRMTQYLVDDMNGGVRAEPLVSRPSPQRENLERRGNADRFVSHSKLPLDYEPPEAEQREPSEVVPMAQPNGMPRAPRDRTRAQRAALAIHDKEGNIAQVLSPEAIARA